MTMYIMITSMKSLNLTGDEPYWRRYDLVPANVQITLYCVPTSPGCSRLYYCLLADGSKFPRKVKRMVAMTPRWLKFANHYNRNDVMDGDNVLLNKQVSKASLQSLTTAQACRIQTHTFMCMTLYEIPDHVNLTAELSLSDAST